MVWTGWQGVNACVDERKLCGVGAVKRCDVEWLTVGEASAGWWGVPGLSNLVSKLHANMHKL